MGPSGGGVQWSGPPPVRLGPPPHVLWVVLGCMGSAPSSHGGCRWGRAVPVALSGSFRAPPEVTPARPSPSPGEMFNYTGNVEKKNPFSQGAPGLRRAGRAAAGGGRGARDAPRVPVGGSPGSRPPVPPPPRFAGGEGSPRSLNPIKLPRRFPFELISGWETRKALIF